MDKQRKKINVDKETYSRLSDKKKDSETWDEFFKRHIAGLDETSEGTTQAKAELRERIREKLSDDHVPEQTI